ncbi:MAG: hypothetical protein Q7J16_12665 [Candidatus Cloacimonadales bacterium]|nr:hypothetical protein [Candidatus Cloacimonadales bacterium]
MKKITILIFILILTSNIIFAQTENLAEKKSNKFSFDQKYFALSPLVSPRICFGMVSTSKLPNKRFAETIVYVHACETFSTYKQYGIAFRMNQFLAKNKKTSLFWIMNVGLDYLQMESLCLDPGGSNCDDKNDVNAGIVPNIATGLGYSFKLGNESFLRLELDIGLKWFLSNVYISFVW